MDSVDVKSQIRGCRFEPRFRQYPSVPFTSHRVDLVSSPSVEPKSRGPVCFRRAHFKRSYNAAGGGVGGVGGTPWQNSVE